LKTKRVTSDEVSVIPSPKRSKVEKKWKNVFVCFNSESSLLSF
jgi:hypothetical protein